MSSDRAAIRVNGISKSFQVNADAHQTFKRQKHSTFQALDDVSFDVAKGEVLGLVGSNGAGKSTLLKILSRITSPDKGTFALTGRLSSLLEVGTGFHPELTGRENIYLNGSILGMSRRDINHKFDDIVEFSEITTFLDTPVKRYSSGMYVRLAFAVASHLTTEILVIDEVLAVGDGAFQSKCIAKMESLASADGRSILLVTHNLAPIRRLCDKVLYLKKGAVQFHGDVAEGLDVYLSDTAGRSLDTAQIQGQVELSSRTNIHPPHELIIRSLTLRDSNEEPTDVLTSGEAATLELTCFDLSAFPSCVLAVRISTTADSLGLASFVYRVPDPHLHTGHTRWTLASPTLTLAPGSFDISVGVLAGPGGHVIDEIRSALTCRVVSSEMDDSEWRRLIGDGVTVINAEWAHVDKKVSP